MDSQSTMNKKVTLLMLKNCNCGNCASLAYLCQSDGKGNYTYYCDNEKSKRPKMSLPESYVPCRFWISEGKRKPVGPR
jgi:hypothetical protein